MTSENTTETGTVDPAANGKILEVNDLKVHFPIMAGLRRHQVATVYAVDGITFELRHGETLGLVGESGCGKSTTARAVLRLNDITDGIVLYKGVDITNATRKQMQPIRKEMQVVFQDPYASLNPRMTVSDIISEPLKVHNIGTKQSRQESVDQLLETVQLSPEHGNRYPHEFSGGQRQRIGVARALALEPEVMILDEPVSALDVSIQAQVINLLKEIQEERGLSYLFIAHDLSVVRHISDRVAVMYLGKIVEVATRTELFESPSHPYTVALLSAVPIAEPHGREDRKRIVLEGDVPTPVNPPSGCRFRTRCWKAQNVCAEDEPELVDRGQGHPVACFFPQVEFAKEIPTEGLHLDAAE
ncbi:MAG: dipeptide ABC transporter ATP-binding protein [Actinomycetota bacterium]|nr:dipeptide ABC transporter ATP-binding protein [Actinomycetota bacterium]